MIKDWAEIFKHVGTCDLTAYVNFQQIQEIAKKYSKEDKLITMPSMPQGLFLESMGIRVRLENLMQKATDQSQRKLLEESYVRLCSPAEMGEIYKFLYIGHKDTGDIFPFLGEDTKRKEGYYG